MHRSVNIFILFCLLNSVISQGATVDSVVVFSQSMKKDLKNAVVLPATYKQGKSLPVLYLLHGFSDSFNAWLTKSPDRQLVAQMADTYNIIIVCPDGGYGSWYLDSPEAKDFQYETYIINELIPFIDKKYKTISAKKGRLISGLSMGGHGALYLAARNPDKFIAAGSIAGALDLSASALSNRGGDIQNWFVKLLGNPDKNIELYKTHSVMFLTDKLKASGIKLIVDCGTGDFLFDINQAFHKKMLEEGIPHDYIVRPGVHNWKYFSEALPYHMLFFHKVLIENNQM